MDSLRPVFIRNSRTIYSGQTLESDALYVDELHFPGDLGSLFLIIGKFVAEFALPFSLRCKQTLQESGKSPASMMGQPTPSDHLETSSPPPPPPHCVFDFVRDIDPKTTALVDAMHYVFHISMFPYARCIDISVVMRHLPTVHPTNSNWNAVMTSYVDRRRPFVGHFLCVVIFF